MLPTSIDPMISHNNSSLDQRFTSDFSRVQVLDGVGGQATSGSGEAVYHCGDQVARASFPYKEADLALIEDRLSR